MTYCELPGPVASEQTDNLRMRRFRPLRHSRDRGNVSHETSLPAANMVHLGTSSDAPPLARVAFDLGRSVQQQICGEAQAESELACELRKNSSLDVRIISPLNYQSSDLLPTWLQDGADTHGSHASFYWLRTRGSGVFVRLGKSGLAVTWRQDMGGFVALRPVGEAQEIADLLMTVASTVQKKWPGLLLIGRYCGRAVADRLASQGWTYINSSHSGLIDDEAFPEVIITGEPIAMPAGRKYRLIRKAVLRHGADCVYIATENPIGCGEEDFIRHRAARASHYLEPERNFNEAVIDILNRGSCVGVTFHYLFRSGSLAGFSITARTGEISHGYYIGTINLPRLSAYFHWQVYLEECRKGALGFNLGGSEARSLHQFKVRTFPDHIRQRTLALKYSPRNVAMRPGHITPEFA